MDVLIGADASDLVRNPREIPATDGLDVTVAASVGDAIRRLDRSLLGTPPIDGSSFGGSAQVLVAQFGSAGQQCEQAMRTRRIDFMAAIADPQARSSAGILGSVEAGTPQCGPARLAGKADGMLPMAVLKQGPVMAHASFDRRLRHDGSAQ